MLNEAKSRIVAAVDALAKDSTVADRVVIHPETAAKFAIHGTHIDLGSETMFHDAARITAELTHPDYDKVDGVGPGRPKTAEEAAKIAAERNQVSLRRPGVLLLVELSDKATKDKFGVYGSKRHGAEV